MNALFGLLTRIAQRANDAVGPAWRGHIKPAVAGIRPYWHRIKFLLNAFKFERFGPRCSLAGPVKILGAPTIRLGKHVAFRSHITIGGNGLLEINDDAVINDYCQISAFDHIKIGRHVMIASLVSILDIDHSHEDPDKPIDQQGYVTAPVIIEDGVWIGTHCVITRGVRIGKNSIIAANSVVTRDIPPDTIAAGSPAVVIKSRRREESIKG